jgi:hypothetical protein
MKLNTELAIYLEYQKEYGTQRSKILFKDSIELQIFIDKLDKLIGKGWNISYQRSTKDIICQDLPVNE